MKNRRTLEWIALAAIVALPLLSPASAFAYGEQITQAGIQLYTWVRGLGALILVFGLCGVGFKLAVSHDREGLKPFFYVVLGGLIVFLAPSIVGLLQGVAGSAAAINTSGL